MFLNVLLLAPRTAVAVLNAMWQELMDHQAKERAQPVPAAKRKPAKR
jgi:hypothetical protein